MYIASPLLRFRGARQADHILLCASIRPLSECSGQIAFPLGGLERGYFGSSWGISGNGRLG